MEVKAVYEGFFLTCEAGTDICRLKCFNKSAVDTGSKCELFGIATTEDNTVSNIESTVGDNFGVCAVKGKCDLVKLGEWENYNTDLNIGGAFLLKLDSKLPCTASFIKVMDKSEYEIQYGLSQPRTKISSVTSSSSSTAGDFMSGNPQGMVTVQGSTLQKISIHESLESALSSVANSSSYMKYLNEENIALNVLGGQIAFLLLPVSEMIAVGIATLPTEAKAAVYSTMVTDLETRYDTYKKQSEMAKNQEVKKFYKDLYVSGMIRDYGLPVATGVVGKTLGGMKVSNVDYRNRDFSLMPKEGNFSSYNSSNVNSIKNVHARAEISKLEIVARLNNQGSVITGGGSIGGAPDKGMIQTRVYMERMSLPNRYLKSFGNMGYVYVNVKGKFGLAHIERFAHSDMNTVNKKGYVEGKYAVKPENPTFNAQFADKKSVHSKKISKKIYFRDKDTEYKLLNNIDEVLSGDLEATGKIILYSEKYTCPSCSSIIMEFRNKYSNIDLEIITSDGKTPIPMDKNKK